MKIVKPPMPVSFGARPGGRSIRMLASSYPRGTRLDLHMHREAQLVFAADGLMQVETPKGRWLVPPDRAVWVPARLAHAIDVLADVEMRSIYFQPRWLAGQKIGRSLRSEFVVHVAPLLRELILALFAADQDRRQRMLLAQVIVGELGRAGDGSTFMPMPAEARARKVAEMLLDDPSDQRDLDSLAQAVGVSGRTLTRLFARETRLSFKTWRQRARIIAAIELLGQPRQSIKRVAARLGFSSAAAFSFAFRQVTGQTPTAFLSRRGL